MSYPEIIDPILDDIVDRLIDRIGFLSPGSGGTCSKVGDVALFTNFGQVTAPFAFVQYGGEVAGEIENMGANPVVQTEGMQFQIWLGAMSFSITGDGISDKHGRVGLNTLVDSVWYALTGYLLPSAQKAQLALSRLYHAANSTPTVEDYRVISISTWRTNFVRQGLSD